MIRITKQSRHMGINLEGLYILPKIEIFDKDIDVTLYVYANREAFEEDSRNHFIVPNLKRHFKFTHTDGSDIMRVVKEGVIKYLTESEFVTAKQVKDETKR